MPRIRNAKLLAKRIDLQYFTHPHGFRRARFVLSIALPLIAAAWLLGERAIGNTKVYTSGPISAAHAVLGKQCAVCHVRQGDFRAHVPDTACLKCHDAPVHNVKQTFTPSCSSCHLEHQGRIKLAATANAGCTQCHNNLQTTDGKTELISHIGGFDHDHPQFAVLRQNGKDPGTLKLNHFVHLQPTLRGPAGAVQMQCDDCHRFAVTQNWPYSVATVQPATQQPVIVTPALNQQRKRREVEVGANAYGIPIRYVNQCAACHLLQFDTLITEPAPHDKPEIVRAFIRQKLTAYVAANPNVVTMPIDAGLPGNDIEPRRNILRPEEPARPITPTRVTPQEWVDQRTATAERLLWSKNCRLCHAVTEGEEGALPTKVTAIIPTRWMPRAEFDHQPHRMVTCTACHSTIPQSRLTSDVNLAGIELCRDCHAEGGLKAGNAEGRCFECHSYHDWRKEKLTKGSFDVLQVRGKGPAATAVTAPTSGTQ